MVYDYIVIGGGSAGCVAANRLAIDHGARVLVLEAGPPDDDMLIRMPAGSFKMMFNRQSPYLKRHASAPEPTLGGRSVPIAQASVIGGGSSVNVMAYLRGTRADFARWDEATGGAGWTWDDLLPFFKRQEGNSRLADGAHGTAGPFKVSDPRYVCKAAHLFVETLRNAGVPLRTDFNAGELLGVGYMQASMANGRRCSAADAFLHPLKGNPRVTVLANAKAARIVFDRARAVGVEYLANGGLRRARAGAEIVLAAGALATPKLLMLSGVGPAGHLREHGIDIVADLRGVGQNLQDHHMAAVSLQTDKAYGYLHQDRGVRMLRNGLQYLLFKRGPIASNGGETVAFVDLGQGGEPDTQIYGVGMMWPDPSGNRPEVHGISLVASLLQPRSRGSVTLRSADPDDDPVIRFNWLSDPVDGEKLVRALRYLRELSATPPLARAVVHEFRPGPEIGTDAELLDYVRATTDTNYHPVGTCRMGREDDDAAVLTPDLRVKGVDGLRVFDASMMPSLISANTNATVMAVADKGVAMMMAKPG